MEFNTLDAQREACEAYITSHRSEGWFLVADHYDDGGFSGGNLERPALKRLLADIEAGRINVVVVYKIDRLTRSLLDFAKLVEAFDRRQVTFASVTQSFNTTTSMGRLTLNVLLSFAQFRRWIKLHKMRPWLIGLSRPPSPTIGVQSTSENPHPSPTFLPSWNSSKMAVARKDFLRATRNILM